MQIPLDQLLQYIIGPWGAVVVLCGALYFLWKLFREEQVENRKNFITVGNLTDAVKDLTSELRIRREERDKR